MGEEWAAEGLAVEFDALDVFGLARIVLGQDAEGLVAGQVDGHLGEQGAADGIDGAARAELVEAHGVEDVPSRHLAAVFVARYTIGGIAILRLEDAVHEFLRAPGAVHIVVEVDGVVARLVAVGILANQTRDVGREFCAIDFAGCGKETVEFAGESIFAAHKGDEAVHIVGNKPGPLPGRSFAIVVGTVLTAARVEGRAPLAVLILAAHEAHGGVEILLIGFGKLVVARSNGGFAFALSHLCDTPVVVGVLEGLGHALAREVAGDIAEFVFVAAGSGHDFVAQFPFGQHLRDACRVIFGQTYACHQRLVGVEVALSLGIGIGGEGDEMIAYHAACIVGGQFPFGHDAALLALADEAANVGLVLCGVDNGEQGVQGAEGVPHREYGIVGRVGIGLMYFEVHAEIAAVHIGGEGGRDMRVVHRRIENAQVFVEVRTFKVGG